MMDTHATPPQANRRRDVQRDMKGRYPRHRWPDEPWREDPSLKTRNAFEAQKRS
jgi:ATP-dependent helicase HrpB